MGYLLDFEGLLLRKESAKRDVHKVGWGGPGVFDLAGIGEKCPI
jgi:hypothetical protein